MRFLGYILALVTATFIITACEGDPGQPGVNRLGEDVLAPTVELILPLARQDIYNQVWIEALVQDSGYIDSVRILVDGVPREDGRLTMTQAPFQILWNEIDLENGRHYLQAQAWDRAGHLGMSAWVMVYLRPIEEAPEEDQISYFDPSSEGDFAWLLPDDKPLDDVTRATGYGTRYNINRPALLKEIWGRYYRFSEWTGARWLFEVRTSKDQLPDSLLYTAEFDGKLLWRSTEEIPDDHIKDKRKKINDRLIVPEEFFILAVLDDDQGVDGDTLSILSDTGAWRNYHGYVRRNDRWQLFTSGPRIAFNPMIWITVEYDTTTVE